MSRRTALVAVFGCTLALLFLSTASALAAPSPWWQVLTGSHPTNLWKPEPSVLEITTETAEFGEEGAAIGIEISGTLVGCLGTKNEIGTAVCEFGFGFPVTETASELEALLEAASGNNDIEVSGGPVGGSPFTVTTSGASPAIGFVPAVGSAELETISPGGSGRLILTLTNLGDAPVDATETPVTITDELPEGVVASRVEAFAGVLDFSGPVDCAVESDSLVSCTFEGLLPSYEAIEVEIFASLTGDPPVAGDPGQVTVSGGNAAMASSPQMIKVSPEETRFGIDHFSTQAEEEGGGPVHQAGSHPFQLTTTIQLNSGRLEAGPGRSDASIEQAALPRNLRFSLPAGLVGNATVVARCRMKAFFDLNPKDGCPPETAVGVASATIIEDANLGLTRIAMPVFNLPPAPGEPARFGFSAKGVPVVIGTAVDPDNEYRIVAEVRNTTQLADFLAGSVTLWGSPGDPRHDRSRGWECTNRFPDEGLKPCERPSGLSEVAFLRQPVSCATPLLFGAAIEPWNVPPGSVVEEAQFHDGTMSGCNQVPFNPTLGAAPDNDQAGAASGLAFQLDMPNAGLLDPKFKASEGQAKKVEVTLPEGMTINPSQAEGLTACSSTQYAQETASSLPGVGCPEASKVGSVQVSTPLLEEEAKGSLYVADPYDNPFGSLLALYLVAKIPQRGILIKQAGAVELDPETGQVVTTFDDLPQIPFDTFRLSFFGGNRAPLVMPPNCGPYDIVARFFPWHASDPDNPLPGEIITKTSSFTVDQGPNGRPCPSGPPEFNPDFVAGTVNNAAGSYSPFVAHWTRDDGEQEISRFSLKLPPGVIGNISGIPFCPEAAIAAAAARTGPNGGAEELADPSCPAASALGSTLVGAGVGPSLSYAPGKIYLAGPYEGAKLSIVAIATAKVGPFDLGTVVIRQALRIDSETAEVTSDGLASTPIPHILKGIVTHVRDIRVAVDRPEFILNPTSCERSVVSSTVLGLQPVGLTAPFQAADCASLGLKPKLSLRLRGGTKRGDTPRLRAVLTARKGDANIGRAQVTLPHSAFLEQANIRTICTRVQFNAGGGNGEQCSKGAIYGSARAVSPLLDEPLVGPVFLRSSDNPLPDLVAALHSPKVDINLAGKIDSVGVGRIRTTFASVPDAPVTKFVLNMQGGDKGLIVNSTDICKGKHRATAFFKGQNGRRHLFNPVVRAKCGGKANKQKR